MHTKLQQLLEKRLDMSRNGAIDWAFGELLAFGSLLLEKTNVRLAGQDSRRGTFVQRHSVLHDRANGQEWIPLTNLSDDQGRFWVYDSLLSEYAAMAFEYGYSVERADALVLWEAQFGDFANGAQSVIDEYISSAEQKWGQQSSVVLLLPHGYEGQGPDHSSARIERYLQMCAQDNMTVARPSTPASYFHLLRRQAYARPRRPLIVFTPKAMLRLRGATSPVEDFLTGRFEPVLDDDRELDKSAVKRVLLHSGKIHWDLRAELEKKPEPRDRPRAPRAVLPGADRRAQRGHRQLPERPAVLGAGRAREPGRLAVHRARGRQAPARPDDQARLARRGGVDGDRVAEGARARAGRDHAEGADAVASASAQGCRHPHLGCRRSDAPAATSVTTTARDREHGRGQQRADREDEHPDAEDGGDDAPSTSRRCRARSSRTAAIMPSA